MVQIERICLDKGLELRASKNPDAADRTSKSTRCTREEPMARRHGSTAGQRVAWVSQLLGRERDVRSGDPAEAAGRGVAADAVHVGGARAGGAGAGVAAA